MDITTLIKFVEEQLDTGKARVREGNTIVFQYQDMQYSMLIESLTGLHPGKVIIQGGISRIAWSGSQIPGSTGEGFMRLYNKARKIWLDHESKTFFDDPKR